MAIQQKPSSSKEQNEKATKGTAPNRHPLNEKSNDRQSKDDSDDERMSGNRTTRNEQNSKESGGLKNKGNQKAS